MFAAYVRRRNQRGLFIFSSRTVNGPSAHSIIAAIMWVLSALPQKSEIIGSDPCHYGPSSLVNDSDPNFQAPLCCTYTSVTTKGLVTSLPPTTATRRILFRRMAVVPMNRTDTSWISTFLY